MGGLLPPGTAELSVEVERALVAVRAARGTSGLQAYQQLMTLRATNEDAFFALLSAYPEEMVPLVYTPTVGDACQKWGSLILRPQVYTPSPPPLSCSPT
jgi:malate dehydrogenase (oxaloacetate-decarboxylating)(NADP+)